MVIIISANFGLKGTINLAASALNVELLLSPTGPMGVRG